MLRFLAPVALAAAVLAPNTSAQWSPIAGSGCPNLPRMIKWAGTTKIGSRNDVAAGCNSISQVPILVVGQPAPLIPVPQPTACTAGCQLAVFPIVAIRGSRGSVQFTLNIPQNPTLVGLVLHFQGACLDSGRSCVNLSQAVAMKVQA